MQPSYFQRFVGPLPDNNIILQTAEKTLTCSHMETMQYLIAKILFETKVLRDEMGILGLSVLLYSVSLSHKHLGYPFCEGQPCPAVVGATPWHRLAIVHKVQLFLWRNSCTKWVCDWPGQWYGYSSRQQSFYKALLSLGHEPRLSHWPPLFCNLTLSKLCITKLSSVKHHIYSLDVWNRVLNGFQ